MIIYVESNFVLELAYLQEEHESCEEILNLAQEGKIGLVLPAYSILVPSIGFLKSQPSFLLNWNSSGVLLNSKKHGICRFRIPLCTVLSCRIYLPLLQKNQSALLQRTQRTLLILISTPSLNLWLQASNAIQRWPRVRQELHLKHHSQTHS